jgi:integrase
VVADAVPVLPADAVDTNGVTAFAITKSEAFRRMTSIVRRAGLDYDALGSVVQAIRKELGLRRPRRAKKLPRLLSRREVVAFFGAVDAGGDLRDQVMLRLLAYTGVRVAELVGIAREHVDLEQLTVRIVQGKGSKDRTTLIPASFRLALQAFIERGPRTGPLFVSRLGTPLSTRRVQQIIADYGATAGITRLHPHAFRHFALTELTRSGLSDAQIQLLSGHASKSSLATYQHLALSDVRDDYQAALKGWGV